MRECQDCRHLMGLVFQTKPYTVLCVMPFMTVLPIRNAKPKLNECLMFLADSKGTEMNSLVALTIKVGSMWMYGEPLEWWLPAPCGIDDHQAGQGDSTSKSA